MKHIFFSMLLLLQFPVWGQDNYFDRYFSPGGGLIISHENPYREELCLNGLWGVQPVDIPAGWTPGTGVPPVLPQAKPDQWEAVKIKIPSPINVNNWGAGQNTGEGTSQPYAPGSVYYPSYPEKWADVKMAWLKKEFQVPEGWNGKRLILHFEAVAGECVVLINGQEIARNFDAWLPFDADITDYVKNNSPNEIRVGVRHTRIFDKKHEAYSHFGAVYPTGSNTDNLLGIWQDVFLFALPELRVTEVFVKPWVDRDELEFEIRIINQSAKKRQFTLEGDIREWINNKRSEKNSVLAPEPDWQLGGTALQLQSGKIQLNPGETHTLIIRIPVGETLKKWSPATPELYALLVDIKEGKTIHDRKATRFGWRQFNISGKDFYLNGEKIQCFGDIQHPFGPYICSRRFAWAWYQMIKDFGGNAVRPHAQPWPRVYYELADEMGLMVLDETALFGSSIRLNLEEDITWQRSQEHLERLINRDKNYPSVIGWSAGNEMFAIALLNKPEKTVSDVWDRKMTDMTLSIRKLDPTRDFITLDGDRDMEGALPVWSKHFAHGLRLEDLPRELDKPLIVGESGATYYGRPSQLYPFAGEKAFESYYGRNEALAVDAYLNAVYMARPYLAYFSPSEVCWFGIEHMNLGYHDFTRLPSINDSIFPAKPYEEGKPGYQFERIPPYVTTFNPGLDARLPLYKPLPMFKALQAALSQQQPQPFPWDTYTEIKRPEKKELPASLELTSRQATALEYSKENQWGACYDLPALYFAEMERDKKIQKIGLAGEIVKNGEIIFTASRTDWSLFNNNAENRKCAQVVLYEQLQKPEGTACQV